MDELYKEIPGLAYLSTFTVDEVIEKLEEAMVLAESEKDYQKYKELKLMTEENRETLEMILAK